MANHVLQGGNAPSKTLTLALITPGVSPELADALTLYAADVATYEASQPGPGDEFDYTNYHRVRDFPARTADDIAAKLALAMRELRGDRITPAEVVINAEFCFDMTSEDLVLAALTDARRLGQSVDRAAFEAGLAEYRAKRAIADMAPDDDPDAEGKKKVEDWCESMEFLIENIPAPDIAAVITKFDLVTERYEGFEFPVWAGAAIKADLRRLSGADDNDGASPDDVAPLSWHEAMRNYRRRAEALELHPAGYVTPDDPNDKRLQEAVIPVSQAADAALLALIQTPAPDHAALIAKMDICRAEHVDDRFDGIDVHALITADVKRLGGLEA